jgi:hypothetical protein
MTEYIFIVIVVFVIIYALVEGCNVNININVKQEFSSEDRQLLEDLFNKDGDPKTVEETVNVDEVLKNINDFMLGNEDR